MYKGKLFKEGQEVRIVPVEELVRLRDDVDIVCEMFQYGGYKTKIARVVPEKEWWHPDIPEYELEVDNKFWIWYNEILEPIE